MMMILITKLGSWFGFYIKVVIEQVKAGQVGMIKREFGEVIDEKK